MHRFSITRDEADYREFLEHLNVPDGDRLAKAELFREHPDPEKISRFFQQGRIHKDDVQPIVSLLR